MKFAGGLIFLVSFVLTGIAQNDLPAMKPITGRETPAHLAARGFMRGANIANYLEVPPSQSWSMRHTPEDLRLIRAQGFDHIRLPVGWHYYTGPAPDYQISGDIFAKADEMVTNATAFGLNVIMNIHNFDEFYFRQTIGRHWIRHQFCYTKLSCIIKWFLFNLKYRIKQYVLIN